MRTARYVQYRFLSVLNPKKNVYNPACHTINLTSRRPWGLHAILIGGLSFLQYLGKNILTKTLFSQRHTRNMLALNNTAQRHWNIQGTSTAWQLIFRRSEFCKKRQQGKAFSHVLLRSALPYWPFCSSLTLRCSTLLFPILPSLLFSSRLAPALIFSILPFSPLRLSIVSTLQFNCLCFCIYCNLILLFSLLYESGY